ncbi:phosphatidate phosphatase [Angomonas deanei]|uniref:PAP2 superfamily, putative n=1 Tax=Angomonas deanei TaxID=59799 RepID=A0A7G2CTJ2_9TRYP|nr:phosphatidate phosphatase [Angomonas deanei]CAD2222254.1 PAP2 superfamily, putative [Angomonas deanei]|eukprot:EPY24945.1 phosphatidate phosphatase [Angomonas deanei]
MNLHQFFSISSQYRLFDYVVCLALYLIAGLVGSYATPFCRTFRWDDASIRHPYGGKGTFPGWTLTPISLFPCVVYVVCEVLKTYLGSTEGGEEEGPASPTTDSVRVVIGSPTGEGEGFGEMRKGGWYSCVVNCHYWILTQFFSVAVTRFVVDLMKVYAGRLRPDFIARLEQEKITQDTIGKDLCLAARAGRLSFPSGHSGITFSAMLPLSFYLFSLLRGFPRVPNAYRRQRRQAQTVAPSFGIVVLAALPVAFAALVALSRTRDNRHHFSDIVCGSLLGCVAAFFAVCHNFEVNLLKGSLRPRTVVG